MSTVASSRAGRGGGWDRRDNSEGGSQFGNVSRSSLRRNTPTEPDYEAIHNSPEFVELRRRLVTFIFPMGALFLAWYFAYVLLSAYEPQFMSEDVFGSVNMGLILGLLQFVSTAAFMLLYVRYARRRLDPHADQIRKQSRIDDQ